MDLLKSFFIMTNIIIIKIMIIIIMEQNQYYYYLIFKMVHCILNVVVMDNYNLNFIFDLNLFMVEKSEVKKHLDYFSKYSIS